MVLIAVHGTASRLLPAERGTVRLTVQIDGEDRATVVQQLGALHERFVAEAAALVESSAATRWSSVRVQVRPEHRHDAETGTSRVVQVAAASVEVRFRDLDALSAWVVEAGSVLGVAVDGVEWSVTRDRRAEAERELRVEAVHDAVRRAEAYASAVGGSGVALQSMWEDGLRHGEPAPQGRWLAQSRAGSAQPGFELRPERIEIGVDVSADFLIEPGPRP